MPIKQAFSSPSGNLMVLTEAGRLFERIPVRRNSEDGVEEDEAKLSKPKLEHWKFQERNYRWEEITLPPGADPEPEPVKGLQSPK